MAIQVLFQHSFLQFLGHGHVIPQLSPAAWHLIVGGFNPLKYDTAGFLINLGEKEDIVAASVPCISIPFSQGTADCVFQQLHLIYTVILPSSFSLLSQGEEHQHRLQVMALPGPKQQTAVVNKAWIGAVIRSRDIAFLKYGPDYPPPPPRIPYNTDSLCAMPERSVCVSVQTIPGLQNTSASLPLGDSPSPLRRVPWSCYKY